jgi:cysteine desulfurase / selenocysteine lyase
MSTYGRPTLLNMMRVLCPCVRLAPNAIMTQNFVSHTYPRPPLQTSISINQPAYDLEALRAQFEITETGQAYLNHAGMSPLALPVKQAMIDAIEAMAQEGSQVYTRIQEPAHDEALRALGKLVNCAPDEIAFVDTTSMGINLIANSLPLKSGDNVLLCDTEFPSNVYPWLNLKRHGIKTRFVETRKGGLSLEALDAKRNARSRVVAVSAVQFFSGRRENLAEIGRYCAQHNLWLIVDAMQAVGIIPIDMEAMGIHALAAGGQKALLGPPGQGFMAIRRDLLEQMSPVFAGPLSIVDWDHWLRYDLTFRTAARRFEMGTTNLTGLMGLLAAVKMLLELGPENISEWVTHLSDIAIEALLALGYQVLTPLACAEHAHIVTFAVQDDPSQLVQRFQDAGIILRSHEDAVGNGYLRISSHAYNTVEEIQRVGKVLEELSHE